ncbi:AAA family ATPase [Amycolatopsis sp. NBC_01488]|uniref:AAA family ATPase n=1 Tax=Amycolatopsis sp. NBC_01488 TaxID=2903563 RepID=UPI002E2C3CB8|nr:AAA family ATPase [Amycolatopsis sp. NBC_01488]
MTVLAAGAGADLLAERVSETALLTGLLTELEQGKSGIAVVTGLPGTGRTSLLSLLAARGQDRPIQVLSARGSLTESALRFGVVSQLASALPDRAVARALGELLATGALDEGSPELWHPFVEAARRRPVLLLLDDAHLMDDSSKAWLGALLRRLWQVPLLVVITGAGVVLPFFDQETAEPWQLSGLNWHATHVVRLRPLSRSGVAEVVRAHGAGPGDEDFVTELHAATGGNPALVRVVLDHCRTDPEPGARPDRLAADARRDQMLGLLGRLPDDLRRLLRAFVVAGHLLTPDQLGPLAGRQTLAPARAWRVLAGIGLVPGRGRCADPAIATWVLAGMTRAERAELYGAAAELAHRCALPEEDVARLLLGAGPTGTRWALDALLAAARSAAGEAAPYYRRALREPLADTTRAQLTLELAAADGVAPHTGEVRLARAALTATTDRLRCDRLAAADLLVTRCAPERAAGLLTGLAAGTETAGRGTLAALHWLATDSPDGVPALGIPAAAYAEDRLDPDRAGAAAWLTATRGTDPRRARKLARVALSPGRDGTRLYAPRIAAAWTLMATDDPLEAAEGLDGVLADARRRGSRAAAALALVTRGRLSLRRGRVPAAEADAEAAVEGYPLTRWPPPMARALLGLQILLGLARGDRDAAERAAVTPTRGTAARRGRHHLDTQLLFARGLLDWTGQRPQAALHHFQECGRILLSRGWVNPALLPWRSLAGVAQRDLGHPEAAEELLTTEWELARAWGTRTATGLTHLFAGIALPAGSASFRLTRAVEALRDSPERIWYVTAVLRLAEAQLDAGQPAGVSGLLHEAGRLAKAYRLDAQSARVRDLTARLAAQPRPAGSAQRADRKRQALSETSARVVDMVVQGLPNAEIARRLAVGKRAVEVRLTRVYRHFGVTGRAELRALFALEDGEFGTPC